MSGNRTRSPRFPSAGYLLTLSFLSPVCPHPSFPLSFICCSLFSIDFWSVSTYSPHLQCLSLSLTQYQQQQERQQQECLLVAASTTPPSTTYAFYATLRNVSKRLCTRLYPAGWHLWRLKAAVLASRVAAAVCLLG